MRILGRVEGNGPLERHLATFTRTSSGPHIQVGDQLTDREYAEFRGVQRTLSEFLEMAPAYAVRDQHQAFQAAMVTVEQELAQGLISPEVAGRRVGTSADNVLSTLRGFADKTPRLIRRSWTDADAQAEAFNTFLSGVYDADADYRLVDQLRNYSQHAGLFPDLRRHEWLDEKDRPHSEFQATLGVDFLLKDYKKWKAIVRSDLEEREDRIIHLDGVVEHLTFVVEIVWASTLLMLKAPLTAAAQHLVDLSFRAPQKGGTTHVVSYHAPLEKVAMHDEYIRMDLVRMLPATLAESTRRLGVESR